MIPFSSTFTDSQRYRLLSVAPSLRQNTHNMTNNTEQYDALIIGGGLSGLCAALYLGRRGIKTSLIDYAIDRSIGGLGGFARFSGAKFSLPPAGMGLLPIVGSHERLLEKIEDVLVLLKLDGKLHQNSMDYDVDFRDKKIASDVRARRYRSIVLTPSEISDTICDLSSRVTTVCDVLHGECLQIINTSHGWRVEYTTPGDVERAFILSNTVFFAGGRTGSNLLSAAGCKETNGKGIDLGVRVEFPDKEDLNKLRDLGPDAKILSGACRTFCLNVPGEIFRYRYGSISIPGGIVAEESHGAGNVGLLYRHPDKTASLAHVLSKANSIGDFHETKYFSNESFFGAAEQPLAELYGKDITNTLFSFGMALNNVGLLDWHRPHYIHIPLLDWHWPTYSLPGTFQSTSAGLYVVGDCSGHARGLLQAAASGYIAAEEFAG